MKHIAINKAIAINEATIINKDERKARTKVMEIN
jgi:hypothetical protein